MLLSSGPDLEITAALLPTAPAAASADRASLKQVERSHTLAVLRQTNWRIDRAQGAARILKLHPNTLRSRMQRLGIRRTAHEGE